MNRIERRLAASVAVAALAIPGSAAPAEAAGTPVTPMRCRLQVDLAPQERPGADGPIVVAQLSQYCKDGTAPGSKIVHQELDGSLRQGAGIGPFLVFREKTHGFESRPGAGSVTVPLTLTCKGNTEKTWRVFAKGTATDAKGKTDTRTIFKNSKVRCNV